VAIAAREFAEMAAVLDGHMKDREFVLGERVSVVDFVLSYTLDWGSEVKLLGDFPRLVTYVERMYARPKAPMRIAQAFASIR